MQKLLLVLVSLAVCYCGIDRSAESLKNRLVYEDPEVTYSSLQCHHHDVHDKNKFLYLVNSGLLLSAMKRFAESNDFFERAFLFGEDRGIYRHDRITYTGEYHEHLMILYYKVLNYLEMGRPDEASVECKRLLIRQRRFDQHLRSRPTYEEDGFLEILMGITFEMNKDFDDAFEAYRQAVEVYEDDFPGPAGVPEQLKKDLLRTAWLSDRHYDFVNYKKRFRMPHYFVSAENEGELVVFWNNGHCPIKGSWTACFDVSLDREFLSVSNKNLELTFDYILDKKEEVLFQKAHLNGIRIQFPRYLEITPYFTEASVEVDGSSEGFQLLKDINRIESKQQMDLIRRRLNKHKLLREIEYRLSNTFKPQRAGLQEDESLKLTQSNSDFRCWETLPHSISYCRIPIKEGNHTVMVRLEGAKGSERHVYPISIVGRQFIFKTLNSMQWESPDNNKLYR